MVINKNTKGTNYLDRHDVACPVGWGIQSFYIKSNGSNNRVQYKFTCVKMSSATCKDEKNTPTDSSSNYQSIYLDRQYVQATKNNWFINRFYLRTHNQNFWYEYKVCDSFEPLPPKQPEVDLDVPEELRQIRRNSDNHNHK